MNPIQKLIAQRWFALTQTSRKTRIVSAGAAGLALCAFGAVAVAPIASEPDDVAVKSVAENLALPNLADQIAALQEDDQQFIHEERVRSGDSIGSTLSRMGVDDADAQKFIRTDNLARRVLSLKNGKRLQAETDENGQLLSLRATIPGRIALPRS